MLGQDQAASGGKPGTNITFIYYSYKTEYNLLILRQKNTVCLIRIITGMQKAIPKE